MASMRILPFSIILFGIMASHHIATAFRLGHVGIGAKQRQKAENNSISNSNSTSLFYPEDPLPPSFQELLAKGKLWTLLVLATVFENNKFGKTLEPYKDSVHIDTPFEEQASQVWAVAPFLLAKLGHKNAVVHIWKGPEGDRTLYVAFSPARDGSYSLFHLKQIMDEGTPLDSEEDGIIMSNYVKRKFDDLWFDGPKGGLKSKFRALLSEPEYKGYTVLFGGLSLGGTMSQIAAHRFMKDFEWPSFYVTVWNAFPWTTRKGAQKVADRLGDHMLNLIMTQRQHKTLKRYWDPVASYRFRKSHFANMVRVRLLESGCNREKKQQAPGDEAICGNFLACNDNNHCPAEYGHKVRHYRRFVVQMLKLHNAPMALAGTKMATRIAFEKSLQN